MTEFIILSGADILTLCDDKPVTVYVDKKPYVLCTDEYFEKQKKSHRKARMKNDRHRKNRTHHGMYAET